MRTYTTMTPIEAGRQFHRIFADRDAEAMREFVSAHKLDSQNGMYVIDSAYYPSKYQELWRYLFQMADTNDDVHYYMLEKDEGRGAGTHKWAAIYEVKPLEGIEKPRATSSVYDPLEGDTDHIFVISPK